MAVRCSGSVVFCLSGLKKAITDDSKMTEEIKRQSVIVGIAGGSASGKTTFAHALTDALAPLVVETVNLDRYFRRDDPDGPRFTRAATGETAFNANHPDSADNAQLVADLDARKEADDAPDVMIVEGLMTLHVAEIRQRLDLKIFVELDADERALRRLLRDMNGGRGFAEPSAIAAYYLECARVGHARYVEPSRVHADLILRGDSDFSRIAPLVAAAVRALR